MKYAKHEIFASKRSKFATVMHSFRFKSEIDANSNLGVNMELHALAHLEGDDGIEGPIYKRGWAKFIEYDPSKGNPNLKFFENNAFLEQQKKPHDPEAFDDFGEVEIPS